MLAAAQGIGFHAPRATSPALRAAIATLRTQVAPLDEDRFFAPDIAAAAALVESGAFDSGHAALRLA